METTTQTAPVSKKLLWTGWIMGVLPCLMMFFSASMKFSTSPEVAKGFEHLGWRMSQATGLAIVEITCTILYLIPRTAVLGAILLTGYLGGAIATHMRVGDSPGDGIVMQALLGVLLWGGLFLRDPRLRALIPLRRCLSA